MKISIVGIGLLGGSFALGLRSIMEGNEYFGVDINEDHGRLAKELGIVDEVVTFKQALATSDLVLLATPVNVISRQLREALDIIPNNAILIDFGSTKGNFSKVTDDHPKRHQYVSCHPIAGTENSGPEAAFNSLLKHKQMIICDRSKSDPEILETVLGMFRKLEMHISFMNSTEHDHHIAYVSHLSHISSFALGLTVLEKEKNERSIFAMAGSGFSSTVRLAKSSPAMWAPIFSQNAANISEALGAYIEKLVEFKSVIDHGEESKSYELMLKANDIRRVLMGIEKP